MSNPRPQRASEATGGGDIDPQGNMVLTVEALRRSNSQHEPTRTLRLSEAEQSSRESTPVRVSIESLSMRPRSNPRSRTPMRFESPLDPDEFRRESLEPDDVSSPASNEGRRITIRPLAGSAVGTTMVHRIMEERPSANTKSRKQGPSQRKIRRWNNEKFSNLAAEIASSSARGGPAAAALTKAQEEAHLYRAVYDPATHQSGALGRFMKDDSLKGVRDRFFECELPVAVEAPSQPRSHVSHKRPLTADDMMNRIDNRLRRIVIKACTNSYPAAIVVETFETFLVSSFTGKKPKLAADWSNDLLLEPPTITHRKDSRSVAQFFFDANSSSGGFHRLLLHAICQFHGLNAASKMVDIAIDGKKQARALTVIGSMVTETKSRMVEYIAQQNDTGESSSLVAEAQQKLSALAI